MSMDIFRKMLAPLHRRIMMMIARGVIRSIKDTNGLQELQVDLLSEETRDALERFQQYGFTSNPLPGAEGLAVFLGGNRDHGIVIAVDDRRYRLKNLQNGEVAIYDDQGQKVHLKRNNEIEVSTPGKLTINADTEVEINTGTATVNSDSATVNAPSVAINAETGVEVTTPLMSVSGLISCAGIGAGSSPVAGKVTVEGSVEATGEVQDGTGTMNGMRSIYNSHTHPLGGTPSPTM